MTTTDPTAPNPASPAQASPAQASPTQASPAPGASGSPSPSGAGSPGAKSSGPASDSPTPSPSGTQSPAQSALSEALAASYAAVYAYGLIGAQSAPDRRDAARSALAAHRLGRDWLRATCAALGLTAPLPAAAYDTGAVTTPEAAAALAQQVELALVPRWSAVAGIVPEPGQRARCVGEAIACATRAIAWGAVPAAFPGTQPAADASASATGSPRS